MATHILLVTFPAQGHINPSLQFAKRLTKMGLRVTFFTTLSAIRRMSGDTSKSNSGVIDFVPFSDGYDDGWSDDSNVQDCMSSLSNRGSKAVADIILSRREDGRPFSRIVYTLLIPWVGIVARSLQVPVTLLWIQPATLFDIYYYYFNGYFSEYSGGDTKQVLELPGLLSLEPSDLPSFLLPTNPNIYDFALPLLKQSFEILDQETFPTVLVNTFDALEFEQLRVVDKYKLTPIGPLIPSAFLDGKDPSDKSFGGDLITQKSSADYIDWLDSKEKSSVIYLAFGSYSQISKSQLEEIAQGLIKTKRPFLWVIRGTEKREKLDEMLSCGEELEKLGMIVPWCTQVEVLSHPSVGCFLTHCGWNSSLDSIVSGVPVVAMPQWSDQATNAKLLQDFWKIGVRARKAEKDGIVEADEIKRCLEIVMDGEEGEQMRNRASKWRELAKEAMKEDGTSNLNLKQFIQNVVDGHCD